MKTLLATMAALAVASTAYGQELKIGVANMSDYIEPGTDHSNVGSQFYTNTFESLISKNPLKGEAEFNPSLATEWKMVTPQMMELKIREGVTFQNGDPMTMEDVLFSLQAMIKVTHDARIERSKEFFGNITRAEAVDDTTLRIYTKRPEPIFELVLASQQASIIPKKYLMGLTGHPEVDEPSDYIAFSKAPIGTGPYRIATFTPEEELIWERYDGYWGDQAPYEKISVRKIAELSPRITALLNGEVDIVTNVPPDQLDVIDNRPGFKTEGAVTPLFHIVFFGGAEDGEVITPELRRAMVRAIDRELLNEALWFGRAVVPNTHTYPQYGDYYTPDIMTFEYDLEEAKKIVSENGLEGTEITFVTHPTYYTNGLLAAQAMQEMWKEIGLNVELSVTETWEEWGDPDRVANWSNPMYFSDPHGSFGKMWAPEGAGITRNYWMPSIGMKAYTEMYDRFRYELDAEKRNAVFAEIMELVKNDAPMLVLYQPFESWGMRDSLDWKPFPGHIPYVLDFRAGMFQDGKFAN